MTDDLDSSIPHIRRCLAELRRRWANHSSTDPLRLSDTLPEDGRSISDFCFSFVTSQQRKRTIKRSDVEPPFRSDQSLSPWNGTGNPPSSP